MAGYDDRDHPGNSSEHWTGKVCIEPDCIRPVGTAWGAHWCFEHSVERINRISGQFDKLANKALDSDAKKTAQVS